MSPLPPPPPDSAPHDSDDGVHSPISGAFPSTVRYQHNHLHQPSSLVHGQFDYPHLSSAASHSASGPPFTASAGHLITSPTTHHQHSYPSDFSFAHRNQDLTRRDYPHPPPPPLRGSAPSAHYPQPAATDHHLGNHHAFSVHPTGMSSSSVSVAVSPSAPAQSNTSANASVSLSAHQQSPTQDMTNNGRKESNVVIACRQCRRRKIRCDSARPVCKNCVRRNNDCEYDAVPKRRGPDKCPGKRQRSCKKRTASDSATGTISDTPGQPIVDPSAPPAKKRRSNPPRPIPQPQIASDGHYHPSPTKGKDNNTVAIAPLTLPSDILDHATNHIPSSPIHSPISQSNINSPRSMPEFEYLKHDSAVPRHHDQQPLPSNFTKQYHQMSGMQHTSSLREGAHPKFPYPHSPTIEVNQKAWLEQFTRTYPLKDIMADISFLFQETSYWLSFVNLNFLLRNLSNPSERSLLQPAFILAALATATLMKSSNLEGGVPGRNRALWLREAAQAALEDSWNNRWIDAPLAEAALILTFFELSAHPRHSPDRIEKAIQFLDNIMQHLAIPALDHRHPDVATFPPDRVPIVPTDDAPDFRSGVALRDRVCTCIVGPGAADNVSPGPQALDLSSSWSYPLPWDATFTTNEIKDEECRRLCWCALGLVASYSAQCTALGREPPRLYLSDPANYAILFPGEVMDRASPTFKSPQSPSPKESIWALYCRSILLWCFCINRIRHPGDSFSNGSAQMHHYQQRSPIEEDVGEWATEAWTESQALQDALEMHVCNLDTSLMYITREYIYNTRLIVTQSFRSLRGLDGPRSMRNGPIFSHKQAEEWLYYQDQVIRRVKHAIQQLNSADHQGYILSRRPYSVYWFFCQLSICLLLWEENRSIVNALELAKSILIPMDVMNALWPSTSVQNQCDELREKLTNACVSVGLEPPPPPSFSLPPILKGM